jgi:uncharacterized heparinase superfamily protein
VKLWRYHLHSMPFLHQDGMTPEARREWMHSWIRGNTEPKGEGWEPFPTSLRLVNWFKVWWTDGVWVSDAPLLASAYAQARQLRRCVEFHLQGNHLFENLKTLFWAGCTFAGAEADTWRTWAARHLVQQLHEQVLPDGGHYERSPMYHALVLEGCLDLLNIQAAWGAQHPDLAALLTSKAQAMLAWLEAMTHPDGAIALFNDAAFHIAPASHRLLDYGRKLGLSWPAPDPFLHLADSGYVVVRDDGHYLVMDIGPIGPDQQPGHGHCDLFSFEWSCGAQRVICDSGVYAYQDPVMRPYVRSTAAHNTIRLDGEDQSEVWKEFRVARRAHPQELHVEHIGNGTVWVVGHHDGYCRLTGRPVHRRAFRFRAGHLSIVDEISGSGTHDIEAFVHHHPAITVRHEPPQAFALFHGECAIGRIECAAWQQADLRQGWYCPEFGRREVNTVLHLGSRVRLPFRGHLDIFLRATP